MHGYARSLRALPPVIVVLLALVLVLSQWPSGPDAPTLAGGTLGDVAVFTFLLAAWTARSVLDTPPDEQRALTTTAAGGPFLPATAALLAAYLVNLTLTVLVVALPLIQCGSAGTGASAMLAGTALNALTALAGTLLGACTQRAFIPSPAHSLLALLTATTTALLLSIGPLSPLSIPMIEWIRAAHTSPEAFTTAFPGLAVHLTLWCAAATTVHLLLARRPR
ncbi:hypothetical protein [Thermomonospora amylolytica]|uniref:hypothetical protein n=1 Tax=Thermomonospora amylolytica TaxID=1411117 RepID=UPI001300811A|nr:hypothetical protein [Thermomonospora amylolytica]